MTGPTGVGKSAFAVALAGKIQGEIVGADAFQIYSGLPILTAQPGPELLAGAPHHLVGILGLEETCDAARYARMATETIREIQSRGQTPILVGGTGLYLKALTHGLANLPPVDPALRKKIAGMELPEALARLRESDGDAPGQIDAKNPARVRRALEIVLSTGRPLSASRTTWKSSGGDFRGIILERDRPDLRMRVAAHVDGMFDEGVIGEVRKAKNAGPGASRAIGFREIQDLIAGRITRHECRNRIVTSTCRYAKRQLTWCRHQFTFPAINLTPTTSPNELIETALRLMDGLDS
ncbi:MAG: tRNA (adenosine(37)-N6)-dimethylallyltransferase MiaA [Terrimicrobiaceae bacterium]|nr:tRNA (adenosine(37)-N6)-dimethylallyltransferase MiaA [Terrimicrobiaceae bacterium]